MQALALDIRLLDENDNEVDMRNIEEEEHRFPSIDKDEVIETPETEDELEEEILEDDLDVEEEEDFEDIDEDF